MMSPAGADHGDIALVIGGLIWNYVRANKLGKVYAAETGFLISTRPDTVRAPDVAFVCRERLGEVGDVEGYWPGAPDLVVEVISPGDVYTEVEEKVFDWLGAGARMVVVVNPRKRAVTVYRSFSDIVVLTENGTWEGGEVVPGWSMTVKGHI